MIQIIQFIVWFVVLHTVVNYYWTTGPTDKWWIICLVNVILSIIMVSKGE